MSTRLPSRIERIAQVIREPSVSSAAPGWDQSNQSVIDLLSDWLSELGCAIERMPVHDQPKKTNLIATFGKGPGGLVLEHRTVFSVSAAHALSEHAEILRAAEKLTGEGAMTVAFGTEAPFLAALGTDTIVLGPGGITEAHRPDEFLRVERLEPTLRVLRGLVQRFCIDP